MNVRRRQSHIAVFITLLIVCISANASEVMQGSWKGELKVSKAMSLPLILNVTTENGALKANLDSPKQMAYGLAVKTITFVNNKLTFTSPDLGVTYEGTYKDGMVKGTFKQQGNELPLDLIKQTPAEKQESAKGPNRPQTPKAPFDYVIQDVTFKNELSNITLSGTLTLPNGPGPFATAVLVTGSGPQDRDSTIMGHKSFWVIADHLTKAGMAVLRYDDRGVSQSEGDFSTSTIPDFVTDVQAAVEYLKSHDKVDHKKIGIIGHSEGGYVGPMAAQNSLDVDFVVMIAGPSMRGDRLWALQQRTLVALTGQPIDLDKFEQLHIDGSAMAIAQKPKSEIISHYLAGGYPEDQAVQLADFLTTPWANSFLKVEPKNFLRNTSTPTLALFGEKDAQVPAKENEAVIKGFDNNNITVKRFSRLNHLFQTAETGSPSEYSVIEETFSPGALDYMTSWLLKQ